jgi:hypothetical protein
MAEAFMEGAQVVILVMPWICRFPIVANGFQRGERLWRVDGLWRLRVCELRNGWRWHRLV